MRLLDTPVCDPFFMGEKPVVVIKVSGFDNPIKIELDPKAAPITVSYFLTLVNQGFYTGTKFHRVVPGFLAQGGDPTGTGDGETDCYVKGEFAANGVNNPLTHEPGTISLARQEGYDTASCQFFLLANEVSFMDGEYAAFGHAIEGLDVIEEMCIQDTNPDESPVTPLVMEQVYVER